MPITINNQRRFINSNEEDDDDENHWYHPRSSSPPIHQSLSTTTDSWGFDVNRSTNGQTPSNNNNSDHHTIPTATKDYNERFVDISSPPQSSKLRTPTLTRHRNGHEFAAVDRLLVGPKHKLSHMSSNNQSHPKTQTEHELFTWQNRMLERDQRSDDQSPKISSKQNGSQSSSRQISRPISVMSNMSDSQHLEHDHHEPMIKSARVIKRYIELLYHLQSFYERITDQLFNGNTFLRDNFSSQQSSQSIFINHCRKIAEQLQDSKPIWERKLVELQNLLKDISSFERSILKNETTFLQRPTTLINLIQKFNTKKDRNDTRVSILTDIDRVLYEDKLAVQLQGELLTLLQHQSLLNDFTSLLQWNRQIYSSNEQKRVENVLPLLREQITTTEGYVSHVSQQLTELVTNLRSLEKYILSYTNTAPLIDDEMVPSQRISSNRGRWRPYNESDLDPMRIKESRLQQYHPSDSSNYPNDGPSKTRSVSMPRYIDPEDLIHNFDRDDIRIPTRKNNIHLNKNNSNNNGISTRTAIVKPARLDNGIKPNSVLKPYRHSCSSKEIKQDFDAEATEAEMFIPNKVDMPNRLVDFDNDNPILSANERIAKMKKKEDVRKMLSKQNMHKTNDRDFSDGDIRLAYNQRGYGKEREKALNLQSVLAEEAKEKKRQVSGKHYFKKTYQPRSTDPNS